MEKLEQLPPHERDYVLSRIYSLCTDVVSCAIALAQGSLQEAIEGSPRMAFIAAFFSSPRIKPGYINLDERLRVFVDWSTERMGLAALTFEIELVN